MKPCQQEKAIQELLARLTALRDQLQYCEQQYADAKRDAIPEEIRLLLEDIDAACLPQIKEVTEAINQAEQEIKAAVSTYGYTVKGSRYHAVWSKPRVRWDDAFLQGYAAAHEEILQARCETEPTVSIRRV